MIIDGLPNAFLGRYRPERVKPEPGAILMTGLLGGLLFHSGIWTGENRLVERNGDGDVREVGLETFRAASVFRFGGGLWAACDDSGQVLCDAQIAFRAMTRRGEHTPYELTRYNCHQFVSGCITGDRENGDTLFFLLNRTLSRHYGLESFPVWHPVRNG